MTQDVERALPEIRWPEGAFEILGAARGHLDGVVDDLAKLATFCRASGSGGLATDIDGAIHDARHSLADLARIERTLHAVHDRLPRP